MFFSPYVVVLAVVWVVLGFAFGKLSLRIIRYPERYTWIMGTLLFPLSVGFSPSVKEGIRFYLLDDYIASLFSLMRVREQHLRTDSYDARRARFRYIFATALICPVRFLWMLGGVSIIMLWIFGLVIGFFFGPTYRRLVSCDAITGI